MKRKTKKQLTLAQWKQVMERHRRKMKKVRASDDLLNSRQLTPKQLNLLGTYVPSVLPKDETLQERMCRYCDMAGYEYRQKGKAIEYDTPSGITVTIYPWPIRLFELNHHWNLYGHFDRHDRFGLKYINEPKAKYLYDLLWKKMEELEQNKPKEDFRKAMMED